MTLPNFPGQITIEPVEYFRGIRRLKPMERAPGKTFVAKRDEWAKLHPTPGWRVRLGPDVCWRAFEDMRAVKEIWKRHPVGKQVHEVSSDPKVQDLQTVKGYLAEIGWEAVALEQGVTGFVAGDRVQEDVTKLDCDWRCGDLRGGVVTTGFGIEDLNLRGFWFYPMHGRTVRMADVIVLSHITLGSKEGAPMFSVKDPVRRTTYYAAVELYAYATRDAILRSPHRTHLFPQGGSAQGYALQISETQPLTKLLEEIHAQGDTVGGPAGRDPEPAQDRA